MKCLLNFQYKKWLEFGYLYRVVGSLVHWGGLRCMIVGYFQRTLVVHVDTETSSCLHLVVANDNNWGWWFMLEVLISYKTFHFVWFWNICWSCRLRNFLAIPRHVIASSDSVGDIQHGICLETARTSFSFLLPLPLLVCIICKKMRDFTSPAWTDLLPLPRQMLFSLDPLRPWLCLLARGGVSHPELSMELSLRWKVLEQHQYFPL